jgi:TrmH family RNA methyltransferase
MIVSRQNQQVKDIRRLRRCKGDRAVLEGPHLVGEALRSGLVPESILASDEFLGSDEGRNLLAGSQIPITEVASHLIEYMGDADSPRGVLAVCSLPRRGLSSVPVVENGLYLYVDGLQDPGNLGALVRVAEAFAVDAVILGPGSVHPNHPRSLRASAGSLLRMDVSVDVGAADLADYLVQEKPLWLALAPRGGIPLGDVETGGGMVLAVGAEGPGLSEAVLNLNPKRVTIPLAGQVESLNSTVAAAIALHSIRASRAGG